MVGQIKGNRFSRTPAHALSLARTMRSILFLYPPTRATVLLRVCAMLFAESRICRLRVGGTTFAAGPQARECAVPLWLLLGDGDHVVVGYAVHQFVVRVDASSRRFFVYDDFEGIFFLGDFFFLQVEGHFFAFWAFEDADFD